MKKTSAFQFIIDNMFYESLINVYWFGWTCNLKINKCKPQMKKIGMQQ